MATVTKFGFNDYHNLVVRDGFITARNFDGNKFGKGGNKSFCLRIDDPEWAEKLRDMGFNILDKCQVSDPDAHTWLLPVSIKFNEWFTPYIVLHNGTSKTILNNDSVATLQPAAISNVKMVIRPKRREDGSITAYLKTMHVYIQTQDEFADDDLAMPDFPAEFTDNPANLPF